MAMKRSSTFLLAAMTALGLAACNPPKSDTGAPAGGGTGSETGAMPADTSAQSTPAPAAGGAATDTGMAKTDTAMKKMDSTKAKK